MNYSLTRGKTLDRNVIFEKYNKYDENSRLTQDRIYKIEFDNICYIVDQFLDKSKSVIELGCGCGIYAFQLVDKCKEYYAVDIIPSHIDQINTKNLLLKKNIFASVQDAVITNFENKKFDVVLSFGPYYHLTKPEKQQSIEECIRICKKGGIICIVYVNKFAMFLSQAIKGNREEDLAIYYKKSILEQNLDNEFFLDDPKVLEETVKSFNLKILNHIGLEGMTKNFDRIKTFSDEEFQVWKKFVFKNLDNQSLLSTSKACMIICKKE